MNCRAFAINNLIEKKEDGYWYLNGAVASHFDVYLNGAKKGLFLYKINDGDTITLCGVAGKGRSEYRGKTFEYQFFSDKVDLYAKFHNE